MENQLLLCACVLQIQGWLFKRGVKGVTAHVWRRRFFRVEGTKIYYYKTSTAPQAQGLVSHLAVYFIKCIYIAVPSHVQYLIMYDS